LACALDPRTKLLIGIPEGEDQNLFWKAVEEAAVNNELNEKSDKSSKSTAALSSANASNKSLPSWCSAFGKSNTTNSNTLNTPSAHLIATAEQSANLTRHLVNQEIESYKMEPKLDFFSSWDPIKNSGEHNNPLDWWKSKRTNFPLLSKLSRKILAQPATSAPSERLFSSAGLTIAEDRSRMDSENAEDLTFLKDNWEEVMAYMAQMNV
jgi:zinc finger BED domain-containing protein 1 (E3 SUMO-protein ligase ZBED1)